MSNSESSQLEKKYQDVVDFEPAVLEIISDEKKLKILKDTNYHVIISILCKGPMTVQEITKAFDEWASMSPRVATKTDKTIYRYLKFLEEAGMVAVAGQRVVIGKTATEKLYMRTARIFERKEFEWMSERGAQWSRRFGTLISFIIDSSYQELSVECLQEFFEKWSNAKKLALETLAKTESEDILALISAGEWVDLIEFIDWVYIFGTLMNQPDLLEQLRSCLKERKNTKGI